MRTIDLVRPVNLHELLGQETQPCVSLYMPTHKKSDQKRQDPLRMKNLLKRAEENLTGTGMRLPDAREVLDPLAELIQDYSFWKHQSEGLAVFAAPETLKYYHLPYAFDETVVAGAHFHFKPLIPLLSRDGLFYILMLTAHAARLFQATRFGVGEISLEGLIPEHPETMKLHHDLERHLSGQTHNRNTNVAGPHGKLPYFFGQGTHCDCRKEDIKQFFEKVDWAVHGMIREDHRPLVLAGVEYVTDIYRGVNHYQYTVPEGLYGNLEAQDERELQRRAFPLVEPVFTRSRKETEQTYLDLTGTLRIDNSIRRILPAAYEGLIQALFVPLKRNIWGVFDGSRNILELHEREEAGDQDLLDLTALYTLLHKGTVYAVPAGELPGTGMLNAVYRF